VIDLEKLNLVTVKDPKSPISEAYRTLRTNIQFSSFDEKVKVIVVTSAGPGEGKSITSANLAVVMAQSGSKTLLIDCDQRKPSIHKIFNISNIYGLSNLLAGEISTECAIIESDIDNLQILTSGAKPPNPSELLGSKKMKLFIDSLRNEYDYIIIDTPPVLAVTDAQVISKYSDGCLLVISSGESEGEVVVKGKEALERVNSKILGVVLNKIKVKSKEYYRKYYCYEKQGKKHKRRTKKI
jgi:capsular exopolysaccharide synthesis family protein